MGGVVTASRRVPPGDHRTVREEAPPVRGGRPVVCDSNPGPSQRNRNGPAAVVTTVPAVWLTSRCTPRPGRRVPGGDAVVGVDARQPLAVRRPPGDSDVGLLLRVHVERDRFPRRHVNDHRRGHGPRPRAPGRMTARPPSGLIAGSGTAPPATTGGVVTSRSSRPSCADQTFTSAGAVLPPGDGDQLAAAVAPEAGDGAGVAQAPAAPGRPSGRGDATPSRAGRRCRAAAVPPAARCGWPSSSRPASTIDCR